MADNISSQDSSPIDLGKLVIDGNNAMLSNQSQSSNGDDPKATLISLISQLSANGNTPNTPNPTGLPQAAIDAAAKVQKDYYTKHAQDLVDQNPNGIAVLNQLIDTHNSVNKNQDNKTVNVPPPTSSEPTMTPIQQQAMGIIQPQGFHPLGAAFNLLGNITGMRAANQATNSVELSNLAQAQRLTGQEPMQQEELQRNKLPLTAAQQAEAAGAYNTALINQHNELQKGITDQITSTATAIDQLVKNTPIGDKAYGSPYYDTLKQLQNRLQGLTNQGKGVVQSFKDLQLKNPSGGNTQSPGIQTFNVGGITYNIPSNKVAAFKKAKGL